MDEIKKNKVTRTALREQAFCLVYEYSFNKQASKEELDRLFDDAVKIYGYEDCDYIRGVFYGVAERSEELDGIISKYAVGWKIERISRVSLSVMRICVYESRYVDDVPPAVAINEAVELAKKYDTEQAPAFINGVLNAALKGEGIM
ncbi:MAG: transcription antitermination factor NusB [Clostridia bacterium]|nr:transcription antitermination factor NusB [Clostridia bacterium]